MQIRLTNNGSTSWVFLHRRSAPATAALQGDLGGGTATLEWAINTGDNPVTATDANGADIARTAPSVESIHAGGIYLRWTLSGATAPNFIAMIDA